MCQTYFENNNSLKRFSLFCTQISVMCSPTFVNAFSGRMPTGNVHIGTHFGTKLLSLIYLDSFGFSLDNEDFWQGPLSWIVFFYIVWTPALQYSELYSRWDKVYVRGKVPRRYLRIHKLVAGTVQTRHHVFSKGQLKEQAGSLVSKSLTLPPDRSWAGGVVWWFSHTITKKGVRK